MNKEESIKLLDEIRYNDSIRHKIIRLSRICSVLENVDLIKTRTFGILSEDFPRVFDRDFPKNGKIAEKIAFFEFLTNNFTLKDFRKKVEHLEYKAKSLINNHAGALLELIIVDSLSRKGLSETPFKHRKGPTEIDGEYKADLITSYKYLTKNFRFGVQLTISNGLKARRKNKKIEGVVNRIDSGKNGEIFGKQMTLDSMIYIKLNGKIAEIIEKSPNIINNAINNWQKNKYSGNVLDYIDNIFLTEEINRFCDIYLLVIEKFFTTIETDGKNNKFRHKIIEIPTGETIDISYSEREKYIKFNIGENGKQLFSINFFLNNKIVEKLKSKQEVTEFNEDELEQNILSISEYKNNSAIKNKVDKIAESKAVMQEIDVIKTRIWGLLSEGFLKNRNISEIRAFYEYLTSKFEPKDFNNSTNKLLQKTDSILNETDGYILEFILIDTLLRMNIDNDLSFSKGIPRLDGEFKIDMITSLIEDGENYRFGNQITTTAENELLIDKDIQIKSVLSKIDSGMKKGKNTYKVNFDSMILIQLNGIFSRSLHKPISPIKEAYKKWKNNNYTGNLIDYIKKKGLAFEIKRFCKNYSFIMQNYIKILKYGIDKININRNSIITKDGEKIKLFYSKKDKTLKFSLYDGEKFLFSMKFYLNTKLINKLKGVKKEVLSEAVNI